MPGFLCSRPLDSSPCSALADAHAAGMPRDVQCEPLLSVQLLTPASKEWCALDRQSSVSPVALLEVSRRDPRVPGGELPPGPPGSCACRPFAGPYDDSESAHQISESLLPVAVTLPLITSAPEARLAPDVSAASVGVMLLLRIQQGMFWPLSGFL